MLNIIRKHFDYLGSTMDYELENGVMLHISEWNGERYCVQENGTEKIFKPEYRVIDAETEKFEIIGFSEA